MLDVINHAKFQLDRLRGFGAPGGRKSLSPIDWRYRPYDSVRTNVLHCDERTFILVFRREVWLVGTTPSTWNFGSNWPSSFKIADFQSIFARSASAAKPSEKRSINTNSKSTTPNELRWTSCVAPKPQKGAQKRKTAVFRLKLHTTWRKSATEFLCVNTVSEKVVRHSLAYLSVQKWFACDGFYYVKIWPELTNHLHQRRFPINIRS